MTDVQRITTSSAPSEPGRGSCVATYRTIHGAQLAARHLDETGFDPSDVEIVPGGTTPPPGWRSRVERRAHPLVPVCVAIASFAVALVALLRATDWNVPAVVFGSLASAAAVGLLAAWFEHVWSTHVRRQARMERTVVAERFEVWCSRGVDRASHTLARWWNPMAEPASRRSITE